MAPSLLSEAASRKACWTLCYLLRAPDCRLVHLDGVHNPFHADLLRARIETGARAEKGCVITKT